MLKYALISVLVVTWGEWEGKSISQLKYQYDANVLYPTSYVYDPTNTKTETKRDL